jgi:Glutamine synthetase, catalytic domain
MPNVIGNSSGCRPGARPCAAGPEFFPEFPPVPPHFPLCSRIEMLIDSSLVREALGDHIFEKFIANKKIEWADYMSHVSQYELNKYLKIL